MALIRSMLLSAMLGWPPGGVRVGPRSRWSEVCRQRNRNTSPGNPGRSDTAAAVAGERLPAAVRR